MHRRINTATPTMIHSVRLGPRVSDAGICVVHYWSISQKRFIINRSLLPTFF
jgi:hypothetical protein